MYQYDDPTAATSLPTPSAAGTPGYFTDGNPATGEQATRLRADFMNALMMELLNVITAAGLVPSKTTYNQLAQAIPKLVSATALAGAGLQPDGSGKLAIIPATAGQVQAGTDNQDPVTSSALHGATVTARAWVNFDGTTGAIRAAYNVSSVTRNSQGNYTLNFATALADANYCVSIMMSDVDGGISPRIHSGTSGGAPTLMSSAAVEISLGNSSGATIDAQVVTVIIFGN